MSTDLDSEENLTFVESDFYWENRFQEVKMKLTNVTTISDSKIGRNAEGIAFVPSQNRYSMWFKLDWLYLRSKYKTPASNKFPSAKDQTVADL